MAAVMPAPSAATSAPAQLQLTHDEAAELTNSIRTSVADLEQLVVRAYFGRAWVAMDYESWDDYVLGEFKRAPLALPREDRKTQVLSLRQQGLSLRAIASATGVSEATARRDTSTASFDAVNTPERTTGLDGKERPATRPTAQKPEKGTPPAQREVCPTCGQTLPTTYNKES
jgi:hypothetical protein